MTEFSASAAYADAVARARQIVAKIGSNTDTTGTKRPLDDIQGPFGIPDAKKMAIDEKLIAQQIANFQAQRPVAGMGSAVEEWKVPDKMVGLIIGKGGEQITRLQAESGCKVQMAADSGGLPDRLCTLTGSRAAIDKAKELITGIIARGGSQPPSVEMNHASDGHSVLEMLIPGPKVGLVIGKGGETIKNLQERAGVRMVLIQDGPQQSSQEKPLRISGSPDKCEYAKQLVMDLLTEKELEGLSRGLGGTNEYGSSAGGMQRSGNTHEIMVPKQAVGVVIGKAGDMIKKIQADSGARVQFLNVKDDGPDDKVCVVTGDPDQIQAAANFISDLIQSVLVRDQGVGRGRGRGRSDGNGAGPPGRGRNDQPELHYAVPANKCGLVIGKGGETIKNINQTSGAYVTLSALPAPTEQEKIFVIKGQPQQIEHAKELINERIGIEGTVVQTKNMDQNFQQFSGQQFGQTPGAAGQPYAPQGWANAYQPWQGQAAANDPNAAAWAAYYSQYYGQQQQPQQQPAAPGTTQPATEQAPGSQPQTAPGVAAPGTAAAAGGATPDYSAAWADYYRSMGMFKEAEMIENQARLNAQQTGSQTPAAGAQPAPPANPAAPPGVAPAAAAPAAPGGFPAGGQWAFGQQFPGQPQQAFVGYGYPGFNQAATSQ